MVENEEKMRDAIIKTPRMSSVSTNYCFLFYLLQDPNLHTVRSLRRGMAYHTTNVQRLNVTV